MGKQEFKQLTIKQRMVCSTIRNAEKFLQELDDNVTKEEIDVRIEAISPLLETYTDLMVKLELLSPHEVESDMEDFESRFFSVLSKLKKLSLKLSGETRVVNLPKSESRSEAVIQLPMIKLQTFSGDYKDWLSFNDNFISLVHSNPNLSNNQKLHYLKSSLKDDALNLIFNISTTSSNYAVAWELLNTRYSNKRKISQNHVKALLDLPPMKDNNFYQLNTVLAEFIKNVGALKSLGENVHTSDFIIVPLLISKLHIALARRLEETLDAECPSFTDVQRFLMNQLHVLEIGDAKDSNFDKGYNKNSNKFGVKQSYKNTQTNYSSLKAVKNSSQKVKGQYACIICKEIHKLYQCPTFSSMNPSIRLKKIEEAKLCINCFNHSHIVKDCSSLFSCRVCNERHNTLVHVDKPLPSVPILTPAPTLYSGKPSSSDNSEILLATALVNIRHLNGTKVCARAILDSGAQNSFITEHLAQQLKLPKFRSDLPVVGITQDKAIINYSTKSVLTSNDPSHENFSLPIDLLIIHKISDRLPQHPILIDRELLPNINLADRHFNRPSKVDMLLGADVMFTALLDGQIRLGPEMPLLQNTTFGWIVAGRCLTSKSGASSNKLDLTSINQFSDPDNLSDLVCRFWQITDLHQDKSLSPMEKEIEANYTKSVTRDPTGRYTVHLPFRADPATLGSSSDLALKRFLKLEAKLIANPDLLLQYCNFMQEYIDLGHMNKISLSDLDHVLSSPHYFIPHRAVIKDSLTTKLRVVFNASMPTTSGVSLNDILHTGPNLQQEPITILLRFRSFQYALVGDVEKMYRMVTVFEPHTNFQLIFWRDNPEKEISIYRLSTLTYGTAPASYLAQRTIHQIALDEQNDYPIASEIIKRDFYVDDLLTGANSEQELESLYTNVNSLLLRGGMKLRKWCSNHQPFLESIRNSSNDPVYSLNLSNDSTIKTLGIVWHPNADTFVYSVNFPLQDTILNKRSILSQISKIYDPLGLLGPVISFAKMFIQSLWLEKLSWDEPISEELSQPWLKLISEFQLLQNFEIPRYFCTPLINSVSIQLHGFGDASEAAYGACVYIRCTYQDNSTSCNLLCSRSRVAPVKRISLPRLELCAALLLSQLMIKVLESLKHMKIDSVFYWSDSMNVLHWISGDSSRWKTFVSNRVTEIQELSSTKGKWLYVPSASNPADLISRGTSPECFIQHQEFWLHGPDILQNNNEFLPPDLGSHLHNPIEEKKTLLSVFPALQSTPNLSNVFNLQNFKNWSTLVKSFALVLRFISNCKLAPNLRSKEPLSLHEVTKSQNMILNYYQYIMFPKEIQQLSKNIPLKSTSKILCLHPFLDSWGLLRVGGRLENASIPYNQKHPILLDGKHPLTNLIVSSYHLSYLHPGPQNLMYLVRQKFWPTNCKNLCKKIFRQCITCFKVSPRPASYLMGNLPKDRVQVSKPFNSCGFDFAGPILYKLSKRKTATSVKGYICIFICLSTKAVHLEFVSDCTTLSFIACFNRFVSRRGLPGNVFCDNATTFVGAKNYLEKQTLKSFHSAISSNFTTEGVNFHFIPARSPTFGGIWESAVKMMKHHLRRVLGSNLLNYEEMSTLLAQIEACLNSRPLCEQSSNPNDLTSLSPGHFLIGQPMSAPPTSSITENMSLISRWHKVQFMTQQFWNRWTKEYLGHLQIRGKWRSDQLPVEVGSLVIMKEDGLPPLKWKMARIKELHPGQDGVPRVATLLTANGTTRRAINRLCVFPL